MLPRIFVYGDSMSWGIVPMSRSRFPFESRWPGVMATTLSSAGLAVHVIEDCLNGRRTVWDDPFKPGRNGLAGLQQRIEINSPPARTPRGTIAPKFEGASAKGKDLAIELEKVAAELGCPFVDAGKVVTTSAVDGVHLDGDQHLVLAHELAQRVANLLDAAPMETR